MSDYSPITPPPELRRLWAQQAQRMDPKDPIAWQEHIANQAARWGADQELEACLKHLIRCGFSDADIHLLRETRRPKPPSLRSQALAALFRLKSGALCADRVTDENTILRALEALPND